MAKETTATVPCLKCGQQPEVRRYFGYSFCVLCFCDGPRGAANCLTLEDAVKEWNRLNIKESTCQPN